MVFMCTLVDCGLCVVVRCMCVVNICEYAMYCQWRHASNIRLASASRLDRIFSAITVWAVGPIRRGVALS